MTAREVLDLLKRYAEAREGGTSRRADFVTWAAHHGLSRRAPVEIIDGAFIDAQGWGLIERVPGAEAEIHPLYRQARATA